MTDVLQHKLGLAEAKLSKAIDELYEVHKEIDQLDNKGRHLKRDLDQFKDRLDSVNTLYQNDEDNSLNYLIGQIAYDLDQIDD